MNYCKQVDRLGSQECATTTFDVSLEKSELQWHTDRHAHRNHATTVPSAHAHQSRHNNNVLVWQWYYHMKIINNQKFPLSSSFVLFSYCTCWQWHSCYQGGRSRTLTAGDGWEEIMGNHSHTHTHTHTHTHIHTYTHSLLPVWRKHSFCLVVASQSMYTTLYQN